MPTRPFTAAELEDAELAMLCAWMLRMRRQGDVPAGRRRLERLLLALAAETLSRSMRMRVGAERLSLARLQREVEEGGDGDGVGVEAREIYARFGFRLADLPRVIDALELPAGFRLKGRHVMSGEEAVLITLRRFKTPGSVAALCEEVGRSEAAISAAHQAVVEHIHRTFPHLLDSRGLSCFAPLFPRFAAAFVEAGVPLHNLIGFVDGKLWAVARPVRGQANPIGAESQPMLSQLRKLKVQVTLL